MADPIISYKRLIHSWSVAKAALDKIIGHINPNTTLTGSRFVRTDSSGNLETPFGFSNTNPPPVAVLASFGNQNSVASGDHVHPNTCPVPTEPAHIVNKDYVDNRLKTSASLGGSPASLSLVANTPVYLVYDNIKNAAMGSVVIFANYYFQVNKSGRYRVSFFGSYKSSASADIKAVVAIDNVDTYIGSIGTRSGSPSVIVSGGATGILDLVAGEAVAVRISSTSDTTLTHELAGFSIESI